MTWFTPRKSARFRAAAVSLLAISYTTLSLTILSPAAAQTPANSDRTFERLDGNHDGILSGTEATSVASYDTDGDREISCEEYDRARAAAVPKLKPDAKTTGAAQAALVAAVKERAAAIFSALDGNADDRLSGTEILPRYASFDADADRRIRREEFVAGMARLLAFDELPTTLERPATTPVVKSEAKPATKTEAKPVVATVSKSPPEKSPPAKTQPAKPAPADPVDWIRVPIGELGVSVAMPERPLYTLGRDSGSYGAYDKSGQLYFLAKFIVLPSKSSDPKQALKACREELKSLGEIDETTPADLDKHPGEFVRISAKDQSTILVRSIYLDGTMLQLTASLSGLPTTEQSIELSRFIASLRLDPAGAKTATKPEGTAAITPNRVHAAFVEALAAKRTSEMYGLFKEELHSEIEFSVFKLYVDAIDEVMGKLQSKGLDDIRLSTERSGDEFFVMARNNVTYADGTIEVYTRNVAGRIDAVKFSAPNLDQRIAARVVLRINTFDEPQAKAFAASLEARSRKFLRTFVDEGPSAAIELFDPLMKVRIDTKSAVAALEPFRRQYGEVGDIEFASLQAEGSLESGFHRLLVKYKLKRPGRADAYVQLTYIPHGLRFVHTGYDFAPVIDKLVDNKPSVARTVIEKPVIDKPAAPLVAYPETAISQAASNPLPRAKPAEKAALEYLRALSAKDLEALASVSAVPWLDDGSRVVDDIAKLRDRLKSEIAAASDGSKLPTEVISSQTFGEVRDTLGSEPFRALADRVVGNDGFVVGVGRSGALFDLMFVKIIDGKAKVVGFLK